MNTEKNDGAELTTAERFRLLNKEVQAKYAVDPDRDVDEIPLAELSPRASKFVSTAIDV